MDIDRREIKRILVITLSNIGDIILTTPVIRVLAKEFSGARIDVMVGPHGREMFEKDPTVFKLIIYDKHISIGQKRRLQLKLKKLRYDLIVDMRNTIFPLLLGPKFRTGTIQHFPATVIHSKDRHLYRLHSLGIANLMEPSYIHIPKEDAEYAEQLLKEMAVGEKIVVISPGAKSHLKRWTVEGFAVVADRLHHECGADVILIGKEEDLATAKEVISRMKHRPHDIIDKTNIRQLAHILKRANLIITNDSAPLHLGCAVGTKVLSIFGPTDPNRYGPTGEFDIVIAKKLFCSPCEKAECDYNYECMKLIAPEEVFDTAKMMLEGYE